MNSYPVSLSILQFFHFLTFAVEVCARTGGNTDRIDRCLFMVYMTSVDGRAGYCCNSVDIVFLPS